MISSPATDTDTGREPSTGTPGRGPSNAGRNTILVALGFLFVTAVYFYTVAGDAQVHLAIAERFSEGEPFHYNPGGELVNATTSPFWTMLLTLAFWVAGDGAPLVLKFLSIGIYAATTWLVWRTSRDWELPDPARWLAVAFFVLYPFIARNAMAGLENVLAGAQILLLLLLLVPERGWLDIRRAVLCGLLLGWMAITRMDVALFAILLFAIGTLRPLASRPIAVSEAEHAEAERPPVARLAAAFGVAAVAALLIAGPWFLYQYAETGKLLSDSMSARLYEGRLSGIAIIPGLYYWHPQVLAQLLFFTLPFLVGSVATIWHGLRGLVSRKPLRSGQEYLRMVTALPLLLAFLAYSGLAGTEHFHRYFLAFYPVYLLVGIDGITAIFSRVRGRHPRIARVLVPATVAFVIVANLIAYLPMIGLTQAFARSLPYLLAARDRRTEDTTQTLLALGSTPDDHMKIAVREVQLRYFLDDRIEVASIDGRTSRDSLQAYDSDSGAPDFELLLESQRPDIVVFNSWCYPEVFGMGARVNSNLLCQWMRKAQELGPGASWEWNGHRVETLPAGGVPLPESVTYTTLEKDRAVKINWAS